jgi:uncharacterized membrane protein YfcA
MLSVVLIAIFLAVLVFSSIFATLGLGGACFYVPIFLWFGIPLNAAVPAGLFLNIITCSVAWYNCRKMFDLKTVFWIFIGTAIGAPLGAWLSTIIPQKIIIGIFAIVLSAGACLMFFWKKKNDSAIVEETAYISSRQLNQIKKVLVGAATGIISGLLGIGGGLFLVPFLIACGFAPNRAAAISFPIVFFASALGLLSHIAVATQFDVCKFHEFTYSCDQIAGHLDYNLMLLTGAAAFIGAFAGSWKMAQAGVANEEPIRRAFAIMLAIFAIKLAYDFLTV